MPFAFKNKPLTKQSFKLSPFASKILIKNVTYQKHMFQKLWQDKSQIKKKKFTQKNVHISTNKIFFF